MQGDNRLMDQMAKLMTNAAGAAKGVRDEITTMMKTQAEKLANDLELVPREEFDAIRALALQTRAQFAALSERLNRLEMQALSLRNRTRQTPLANRPIRRTKVKRRPAR